MEVITWDSLYRWFGPCLAAAMGFYWFWKDKNKESQTEANMSVSNDVPQEKEEVKMTNIYEDLNMGQLLERVMKNIGCHINPGEEDSDDFHVTYQGEHFAIVYSEDSPYISVYDLAWYTAELNDIDNLALVRQAVNACNMQNIATVLYTIDKEENCVSVHTRQCAIFGSYVPDVEDYMRALFENSFRQHHNFYRHIEEIRKEQHV